MEENKLKLFENVAKECVVDYCGYRFAKDRSYMDDKVIVIDVQGGKHKLKAIIVVKWEELWTEVYDVVYDIDYHDMYVGMMESPARELVDQRFSHRYEDRWLKKMQKDGIDIQEGFLN